MALVVKDRVKETTITVGTSTLVLTGAASGFQSFAAIGDGNTTYYTIDGGTEWEVGIGTYTLLGTTLSRDTILESSNGGSAVNFSAGTKNVFVTYPAERALYTDASSNAIALGTPASATLTNATGLPISTGVSGLGANVATFLATPSSANLASAVTDETGTGSLVFATSPTLVTPALGTPSSGTVTNLTGTASININGTVGATTPTTGAFTTLSASGVATFSAGTVADPAITTTGDTNTGIFFPAADTIAFTEGGVEAMRIDSSGVITSGLGGMQVISGTAQATTSGTVKDFTDIPSWVKRITVMYSAVSTSGTSAVILRLGYGATPTYVSTGYRGANNITDNTTGFRTDSGAAASASRNGALILSYFGNNVWSYLTTVAAGNAGYGGGMSPDLGAPLTAIRITTVNGTDTFDAGSINILYE